MNEPSAAQSAVDHLRGLSDAAGRAAADLGDDIAAYADRALATLREGGRLLFCGNGGSAATVEHIATEYLVRFQRERAPLAAIALTAGSATLSASANDFGYENVFVRPLQALGRPGDQLIVHSTSGESANCLAAARCAREAGIAVVALTGAPGGSLADLADLAIRAPGGDTATIQEIHLAIEHTVADHVDACFAAATAGGIQAGP
jgi:D-sedoheptulose 7-phosphate isomerase